MSSCNKCCNFIHPELKIPCQFSGASLQLFEHTSGLFCEFHLPKTDAAPEWDEYFSSNGSYDGFSERLRNSLSRCDLSNRKLPLYGIHFPGSLNIERTLIKADLTSYVTEDGETHPYYICPYGIDLSYSRICDIVFCFLKVQGILDLRHTITSDVLIHNLNASSIIGSGTSASDRISIENCTAETFQFDDIENPVDFRMIKCKSDNGWVSLKNGKFRSTCIKGIAGFDSIMISRSEFIGDLLVSTERSRIYAESSRFHEHCKLSGINFENEDSLKGCIFHRPPDVSDSSIMGFSLLGKAEFLPSSREGDSRLYFELSVVASKLHNRYLQGTFVSLANRSELISAEGTVLGQMRRVSFWYWLLSDYGTSYKRPFFWLIGVFFVAALLYAAARIGISGSSINISAIWDGAVWSLRQIVNPFSYLRQPENYSLKSSLVLLSFFLSLFSLILIALTLLAIRWRFRRD